MARRDEDSFWFKFYPDKYLGGTAGFSLEMHGAYLILLLHQNASGPFEEATAVAIVGDVWMKIRHKFIQLEDGRFINIRMDLESQHRKEISKTNRENIRKRYDRSTTVVPPYYETDTTVLRRSSSSCIVLHSPNNQDMPEHVNICTDMFDKFWASYPKKKNKGDAEKAWKKLREPSATLGLILTALEWQRGAPGWTKDGGQYIPYPASYLNAKGWLDERTTPPRPKTGFACNDGYIGDGQPLLDLLDPTPEPENDTDEQ